MIDDNRGQMTGTPIPIVFIMVVIIGIVVMAEVLEQTGHDDLAAVNELVAALEPAIQLVPVVLIVLMLPVLLSFVGIPVPIGYERGKIKWLTWCHTGMHAHICYWHGDPDEGRAGGLQTIHPDDLSDGENV